MAATSRICPFYPRLRTKNCHTRDVWNRLLQQLKPLAAELVADNLARDGGHRATTAQEEVEPLIGAAWHRGVLGDASVQHMALWDYYPQVRSGRRVTIKGDRPF